MIKDALREAAERMQTALDLLEEDLSTIRTGRASPALVERMPVEYYGTCLLYTSPSPRDRTRSRMPSSA